MHFYLEGYAEMLHLVTTSRGLPPPADQRSGAAAPRRAAGGLSRLWRSMKALVWSRLQP